MHRILWVSLSAALLSVRLSGTAEAAFTEEDFVVIEDLIEAGNWVDLRNFLKQHPELLEGDDPFTHELCRFMSNTTSLYTALVFEQSLFPDLTQRPVEVPTRSVSAPDSETGLGPILNASAIY